jgi:hypothetical protein
MVAVRCSLLLGFEQVLDTHARLPVEGLAGAPHDSNLDRFADEARLHHLADRDLDNRRPALRQNFHEARLG